MTHPSLQIPSDEPSQDADEPPSIIPADLSAGVPAGQSAQPGAAAQAPQSWPGEVKQVEEGLHHHTVHLATPANATLLFALTGSVAIAAIFATLSTSLLRALPGHLGPAHEEPEDSSQQQNGYGGNAPAAALGARSSGKAETFAASAGVLAFVARAVAAALVFTLSLRLFPPSATAPIRFAQALAFTGAVGGLGLHLATMSIPLALAQTHAERILRTGLPLFGAVLGPMAWVVRGLTLIRRMLLRAIGTPDANYGTRRLVEGFRAMVEDAEMKGELGADTRELIANVIEFGAADAAEVMTPRTEIDAIEANATLREAIAVFAECGFSRIPVYVDTIDTIIGTLTALEAAKAVAEDRVETTSIRSVMRPPLLVPETQLVPELLAEFREQRQKMAIVVDEYGGTAGLVTLADVMAEIVGHVQDEFEEEEPPAFQRLPDGRVQVDATEHVADINEEAFLSIPEEEDYETLAGFVLAEFGRFPRAGESFTRDGVTYQVSEATDRRVLKVILASTTGRIQLSEELAAQEKQLKQDREAASGGRDVEGGVDASTGGSRESTSASGKSQGANGAGARDRDSRGSRSTSDRTRPPMAS
ncbi:hemolysin family protein [Saltatorellus ferox]|uniref:hemolysin family protein n=1 Tax=Saltatorellus ferox TaxID=2528018 RepID=UPI003AF3DBCB